MPNLMYQSCYRYQSDRSIWQGHVHAIQKLIIDSYVNDVARHLADRGEAATRVIRPNL